MIRYCIPFWYTLTSRLRPRQDRLSWVLIQPVPQLLLVTLFIPSRALAASAIAALGMVVWQTTYEIGYLANDALTTRRESDPTERLGAVERDRVVRLFVPICVARVLISLAVSFGLLALATYWGIHTNPATFFTLVAVSLIAFAFHNGLRGRVNVLSYATLAMTRYTAVPLLLAPIGHRAAVFVIAVLMVPVPRMLEHATKPKYGFDRFRAALGDFNRFRVLYYLVLVLVAAALSVVSNSGPKAFVVFLYFLIFRTAILMAIRRGAIAPTVHRAYAAPSRSHGHDG